MAEYNTLTNSDLLAIYRDALRGKESDHARRSASPEDYGINFESSIAVLETQIERLRGLVDEYEEKAQLEQAEIAPPVEQFVPGSEDDVPPPPEDPADVPGDIPDEEPEPDDNGS